MIVVQADTVAIVQSTKTTVYNPINAAWTTQFGSGIGRNNIYKIDLMALTQPIDFSSQGADLLNLQTYNKSYLFKYLPNCRGIILDGCTALTSNTTIDEQSVNQMDFSYMTNLRTLSIQNCTGLTADIDLTMCTNLEQVDASGTTINVFVPQNSKLTKYELGTPTQISIVNPTVLQTTGVNVDSNANISSLELVNIPGNKSFTMFYKIMQ